MENCSCNNAKGVSTELRLTDYVNHFNTRLGIKRDHRFIEPGLYKTGEPDKSSPIFVSSNFQMSFNKLRSSLKNLNSWILVIDTKGINVWCAAGKGTFGTDELIEKIKRFNLECISSKKELILPQLSASGVCAHEVKKSTGFKIIYGPIKSKDIPEFIKNDCKATAEMRKISFSFFDRLVLTPLELIQSFKYIFFLAVFFLITGGITSTGLVFKEALNKGGYAIGALLVAWLSGAFLTPLFLPYLPSRYFSIKGFIVGMFTTLLYLFFTGSFENLFLILSFVLFYPSISSFLAFNFTGCTTFTSPSGVAKEFKIFFKPILFLMFSGLLLITLIFWNII